MTTNKQEQKFVVQHLLDVFVALLLPTVLIVLGTLAWSSARVGKSGEKVVAAAAQVWQAGMMLTYEL